MKKILLPITENAKQHARQPNLSTVWFTKNGRDWLLRIDEDSFGCGCDPQDGGPPLDVWWEDMRPRDVAEQIAEGFERGVAAERRRRAAAEEADMDPIEVKP